jgi:hypothetical protein
MWKPGPSARSRPARWWSAAQRAAMQVAATADRKPPGKPAAVPMAAADLRARPRPVARNPTAGIGRTAVRAPARSPMAAARPDSTLRARTTIPTAIATAPRSGLGTRAIPPRPARPAGGDAAGQTLRHRGRHRTAGIAKTCQEPNGGATAVVPRFQCFVTHGSGHGYSAHHRSHFHRHG